MKEKHSPTPGQRNRKRESEGWIQFNLEDKGTEREKEKDTVQPQDRGTGREKVKEGYSLTL